MILFQEMTNPYRVQEIRMKKTRLNKSTDITYIERKNATSDDDNHKRRETRR